jgi:hypothetical protein
MPGPDRWRTASTALLIVSPFIKKTAAASAMRRKYYHDFSPVRYKVAISSGHLAA